MDSFVPCEDLKCVQALICDDKVKSLSIGQIKELISSPKPTPDLCISRITKPCKRQFNRLVYKTQWVVGCSHSNKLYCWCCIFFSNDKNLWSTHGYNDLLNLSGAIRSHAKTKPHLNALKVFNNFGKQVIQPSLSNRNSEEISKYNTRVDHNRNIFQRLVDIISDLAEQELLFRDHEKSKSSLSNGSFSDLLSLLSRHDVFLEKQGIEQSHMSNLSYKIQNDITHSIADVMKNYICFEIKHTKFVSIIITEIPDLSHRGQLCLILRYYFKNGVHNRFMGFINQSENSSADILFNIISELLTKYECITKLVAQSYDGLTYDVRKALQQKVKEICPQVINSWCNGHILPLVLFKSWKNIGEVSLFFSALEGLCNFFSNNTKRVSLYDVYCSRKLPSAPANCWTNLSYAIITVIEQKTKLCTLFSDLRDNDSSLDWDGDTILAAENFDNTLRSFNFNFFLLTFYLLFKKTDCLYNNLQKSQVDVDYCSDKIKEFQSWLSTAFQSEFNKIYDYTLQNSSPPRLKSNVSCAKTEYKRLFVQIISDIYYEINVRYAELYKLKFFQLFDDKEYDNYLSDYPTEAFDSLFDVYSSHFNKQILRNQLVCLYASLELNEHNAYKIIDFINEHNLGDSLPDLFKLACLVVTIPAASAYTERAYLSFNRIQTHLRNTQGQERLSELSMIAIEQQLLTEIKQSPTFYSDVIKSFLVKEKRFELEYKY